MYIGRSTRTQTWTYGFKGRSATITLYFIGACGKTRTCTLFLHQILSLAWLPLHHTGMVLSVGNDPTFLALQASTLTISVKIAFGNATGIRTRDTSVKGK